MAFDPLAAQALQQNRAALGYATRLACSMWGKHYRQDAPNWRPADNLMGVLSQIDNMLTGLGRTDGVDACRVDPVSSRMCERGTKGCTIAHGVNVGPKPLTETGWPYNEKVQCAKRIMEAVDTYHARPDAMNRGALRGVILTELDEYAAGVTRIDETTERTSHADGLPGSSDEVVE